MALDKVTLQILANHCAAATESMAYTLFRTAHSTFVKETEDFTTGLTTIEGKTFASPYDLGATWFVGLDYKPVIDRIAHYEEGDICMTNDPYSGFVCTHSPDIHLWKPVFHQGELVCFAVGHIHNTDVGGAVPASLSRANVEVHQEGIRFPPVKLYRKGVLNRDILDTMLINVRVPDQNWGDLKAQIAAMNTGERKVHEMIARFGLETFKEGMEGLLDYADRQARHLIRQMPDGAYFFADYMDEDSVKGQPCRIAVTLEIKGDEITLDFSESDPQLTSSLNIPTGGNERHVLLMLPIIYVLYTLDHSVLLNAGLSRPCRAVLPEGSVVNPQFPAAVGMRSLAVMRLQSCVYGAFVRALGDKLPAACGDGGPLLNIKTTDDKTGRMMMANLDPITGGGGGTPWRDGTEGSGQNFGFLKNTPVEINEAEVPVKIIRYGLAKDSGGPGKFRGGLGSLLEFQVFSPNTVVTARNRDRTHFTPWGAGGGDAGKPSEFLLNPGGNREVDLGNTDVFTAEPGDRVRISSSGAGGWGAPYERNPSSVQADVKRGFVSLEGAREDYGVVLKDGAVDEAATKRRRKAMAKADDGAFFGFNARRIEHERLWTREAYKALVDVLNALPVTWRFFVKHKVMEAVAALPKAQRKGTPAQVRQIAKRVLADYPQATRRRAAAE